MSCAHNFGFLLAFILYSLLQFLLPRHIRCCKNKMNLKMQRAACLQNNKNDETCKYIAKKKKCRQCCVFLSSIFPVLPSPLFSLLPLCLPDLLDPLLGALSPPSDSCGSVIGWRGWEAGPIGCLCCFSGWRIGSVVSFGNSQKTRTAEMHVAWNRFKQL